MNREGPFRYWYLLYGGQKGNPGSFKRLSGLYAADIFAFIQNRLNIHADS